MELLSTFPCPPPMFRKETNSDKRLLFLFIRLNEFYDVLWYFMSGFVEVD